MEITQGVDFESFGLSEATLRAIRNKGYTVSTPVQAGCIPPMMAGKDVIAKAPTGTGKTMGAQAIAAGLNLPYTLMTCSANTEISDLIGQFIPDADGAGCDSCFGVDIDPKAPEVVLSNAALNGIGPDRMKVCAGDILADASLRAYLGGGYQLVLANIVADVIIPLSAMVRPFLAENGVFICSGIIEHRWVETEAALKANGFAILEHKSEEEWHCFVCR